MLRVIDPTQKEAVVMSRQDALARSQSLGLDLVLIAPNAQPPVAKIIDFKKFLYQEQKKEQEAKKGVKKSTVKDVSISLFMGEADHNRILEKTKEFLREGNQVRINMSLSGRQMSKIPMAIEKTKHFISLLGDVNIAKEPKIEARVIRAVVARKK
jgi:translation initiation factor IF-3